MAPCEKYHLKKGFRGIKARLKTIVILKVLFWLHKIHLQKNFYKQNMYSIVGESSSLVRQGAMQSIF